MGYKIPAQGSKPLILASLQDLWDIMGHYGARQQLKVEQAALVSGHAQGDGEPQGCGYEEGKAASKQHLGPWAAAVPLGCHLPGDTHGAASQGGMARCCCC